MTREIGPELVARIRKFADSLEAIARGEVVLLYSTPQTHATPGEGSVANRTYRKTNGKRRITNMNGEWIPVTERLPDAGVDVLIWSPIDPQFTRFCVAAMDRINGQHLWTSEYGDEMPSHWMPLPAPPTDGN